MRIADDFRLKYFSEGLSELGYSNGRNIIIEPRLAEPGKYEQFDGLAAELVRQRVDVIVAVLNPEIAAARRATTTIPIVMVISGDPEGQGFVRTLARPGGNVTGLAWAMKDEIEEKSVEILAEILPGLQRVAGLLDTGYERTDTYWNMAEGAAARKRLQLRRYKVRSVGELESVFALMKRDGIGAVMVGGGTLFNAAEGRARLAELGLSNRLALHFKLREGAEAGGLVSYGPEIPDFYRRSASYVARILKGEKPSDMAVEHPAKYELVVNLKTAKALGLAIPKFVLLRADRVIE